MSCEFVNLITAFLGFGPILACDSAVSSADSSAAAPLLNGNDSSSAYSQSDTLYGPYLNDDVCIDPSATLWSEPTITAYTEASTEDDSDGSSPSLAMALPFIIGGMSVFENEAEDVSEEPSERDRYLSARGSVEVRQAADIVREAQTRLRRDHGVEISLTELRNVYHYDVAQEYKAANDSGRSNYGSLDNFGSQVDTLVAYYSNPVSRACTPPTAAVQLLLGRLENSYMLEALPNELQARFVADQRTELLRELNRLIGIHDAISYETLPHEVRTDFERRWQTNYTDYIHNYWSEPNQPMPRFESARTEGVVEVAVNDNNPNVVDTSLTLEARLQRAESARNQADPAQASALPAEERLRERELEDRPWESRSEESRAGFERRHEDVNRRDRRRRR